MVMGVFSFRQLGVDLFPRSDPATVFVRVQLPGASPEEVVSQVILPLEEAVAAVSGIDELRAVVSEGELGCSQIRRRPLQAFVEQR